MAGKLYIVPTPVGNLEDMTLRAIRILKEADLVLAEDTRTSSVLLKHYDIHTPLRSHHKFNEHQTVDLVKEKILSGQTVALISDAGTPGISDPGFLLVREALKQEVEVECLPGATAFVPALVQSGFPCSSFYFFGFLPHKKGKETLLKRFAEMEETVVFYESPHRLLKSLAKMAEIMGPDRPVAVAKELTKIHAFTFRGTLCEAIRYFESQPVKGEFVIIV